MLKLFQSIFGGNEKHGTYPESLIEMATERAVDGTDPRLRALPGYRKRLRAPVIRAIDHAIALVDGMPAPLAVIYQTPDIGGWFRLRTGLDGGFGQDLRLGTINVDFVYLLPLGNGPWKFLTGGGPTIVLLTYADDSDDRGTEVTAGGSWLLGFAHDNGFFTEFRIGGGNVPALKMGVGWALKLR